jgi:hypothetical protein
MHLALLVAEGWLVFALLAYLLMLPLLIVARRADAGAEPLDAGAQDWPSPAGWSAVSLAGAPARPIVSGLG